MVTTTSSQRTAISAEPDYGGLYGGLAFLMLVLTSGPMFADIVSDSGTRSFLSLWEMLGSRYGAGLALASLSMVGLAVLLCGVAVVRRETPVGVPIAVAVLGIGGAVMLITRVGTNTQPDLSTTGQMLLMTCWGAVVLGIVHTIHLLVWRSRQ